MLTVTVRDGDRSWIWTAADFIPRPGDATPSTPAHQTRTRGNLQVSFRLADGGDGLSEGQIVLPLRHDWEWGLTFRTATEDPAPLCFGCEGSRAFPFLENFRGLERDSLWILWGASRSVPGDILARRRAA
jgi:hypothetical protein